MKTYLITMICTGAFNVLVRLILLAFADYPRNTEMGRGGDVLALVSATAFLIWAISLLP